MENSALSSLQILTLELSKLLHWICHFFSMIIDELLKDQPVLKMENFTNQKEYPMCHMIANIEYNSFMITINNVS